MCHLPRLILCSLAFLVASSLRAQTTSSSTSSTTSSTTPVSTTAATTTTFTTSAVAVYKLTFENAGENINYRPYQGGYYIAPLQGGTGSLILLLTTGGVKNFYTYANFGELFIAVKSADRKAVLSATAANTVSTTTFFAIGDADDRRHIETRSSDSDVWVAKLLKGYAVSADSEKDLPYGSSSASDIGVAGVSYLRASLDEGMTEDAILNNRTVATQVTDIQTQLTADGYTSGTGTTTTTGTGTTSSAASGTTTSSTSNTSTSNASSATK